MAADGSVIIDTRINTDGIADGRSEIKKAFSGAEQDTKAYSKAVEDAEKSTDGLNEELENTAKSTEAARKKVDDLNDELEETEDAGEDVGNVFGQMFGASALADIAVDALQELGEAMKQFVADAIEASAEVQAENAQFEQTFKELEGTATKSLEAISDEVGVSATRMKTSYAKVFAFTKSIGGDTEHAMDIANRAMKAAADSAAYYDVTIEEATETLQSFLKGNYENDAALGIAATETTRNAKANELYATSFDKLSEAQKVDVLLAMVEAGNEASGALGQAAREADSWTNVTGELEEAWRQFLAVAGEPILEGLIPIIKGITDTIYGLTEATAAEELKSYMSDLADSMEAVNTQFDQTVVKSEASALAAADYVARLEALETAGLDTAASQYEYGRIIEELKTLIPGLNLVIDEQTGLLLTNKDAIKQDIKAWGKSAKIEAWEKKLSAGAEALGDAEVELYEAQYQLNNVKADGEKIDAAVQAKYEELIAAQAELTEHTNSYAQSTYAAAGSNAADAIRKAELTQRVNELSDEYWKLKEQQDANTQKQNELNGVVETARTTVQSYETDLQNTSEAMEQYRVENGLTAASQSDVVANQKAIGDATESTTLEVQALRDAYMSAKESARDSIDSQIGYFDKLTVESDESAEDIVANWAEQKTAFDNYSMNLQKAVDMGLDEALVEQLSNGSAESMAILEEFVNGTDLSVDDINTAFAGMWESRDTASAVMGDIQEGTSKKLEEMKKDVESEWGEMADDVGVAIDEMQREINSLKGRTVYVDVVQRTSSSGSSGGPGTSGTSGTQSAAETAAYNAISAISSPSIPYLARGAVIPPNAPFMAVLGDQRHGTNVEAPLSTIQEAVALVMDDYAAANLAGHEATVAVLKDILEAVLGIELGDGVLADAVRRHNARMAIMRGNV